MNKPRFQIQWLLHVPLVVWALISVFPLLWMLSASFQSNQEIYAGVKLIPDHPQLENYVQAWQKARFSTYFLNSLFYTVAIVGSLVVIGSMAGFAFARLQFPLKNFFYGMILILMFIPIPGVFIPLYLLLVKLGLIDTALGYILPMIQGALPVTIFILRSFIAGLPRELDEAARLDGATVVQLYTKIALPLSAPALATVIVLNTLGVWNEYLLASVVFSDSAKMPLQAGLMTFQGTYFSQYSLMMAGLSIATVPIVILFLFTQRAMIRGVMQGALKG